MIQIFLFILSICSLLGFAIYFQVIFHRELIVRKLTNRKPVAFGELYYQQGEIIVKGLLFRQRFSLSDLKLVKAYCEISYGIEDYDCIDFIFQNGRKILFDGSKEEQRELIDNIFVRELHVEPINWSKYLPHEGNENVIAYKRNG